MGEKTDPPALGHTIDDLLAVMPDASEEEVLERFFELQRQDEVHDAETLSP